MTDQIVRHKNGKNEKLHELWSGEENGVGGVGGSPEGCKVKGTLFIFSYFYIIYYIYLFIFLYYLYIYIILFIFSYFYILYFESLVEKVEKYFWCF